MDRKVKRDSKGMILAAARREFGQRGYAGGRVERIARSAGVNKQLIFYYFGSKAGLFRTMVEQSSGDAKLGVTKADAPGGPLDQFRALLERAFSYLVANADLVRATLPHAGTNDQTWETLGRELERLGDRLRSLVSEAQGLGFVRDDLEPGTVAHLAVATVVGAAVLPGAAGDADRRFLSEIEILVRGLAW